MASQSSVFSQIVQNPTVGRGPVIGADGKQITGSHRGVDLAVKEGSEVRPVSNGTVVFSKTRDDYGNVVVVRHDLTDGNTIFSLYAHMKELSNLEEGAAVTLDTVLGLSGHTGRVYGATGDHVHFEMVQPSAGQIFDKPGTLSNYFSYPLLDPKANPYGLLTWNPTQLDREDLTKTERVAQLRLSDAEFESYKTQLASIETKGKSLEGSYQTTSKNGEYLGRYQIGKNSGLVEAGYMDKTGNWTEYAKAQGVTDNKDFLNNPSAQDDALRRLTEKNAEFVVRKDLDLYIGDTIDGNPLTSAGLLLGAHNSRENIKEYVESIGETNGADGNGFGISNYVALGVKVQPNQIPYTQEGRPPAREGHWEDSTQYDELGNVVSSSGRVWVSDASAIADGKSADVIASGNVRASTEVSRPPYPSNSNTVHHTDGDTTVSYVAKSDSIDGSIHKGDLVTYVQNSEGNLTYFGVTHEDENETTVQERVVDQLTGEVTSSYSQWVGSGPASLQFQGQWDAAGNRTGDRYIQDGETYTRAIDGSGVPQWLNERGQTRQEWLADPNNPLNSTLASGDYRWSDFESSEETQANVDFGNALIEAFQGSQNALVNPGTQYADAVTGNGTASDAGGNGDDTDTSFKVADLRLHALVSYLAGDSAEGAYGAGQIGGFDVLPFNTNSGFLVNAEGEVAGEINQLGNGYVQLKDLGGNIAFVNEQTGQALSSESYEKAQAGEAGTALGLMQSIIGLDRWESMSDLQRIATVASIYTAVDKLSDGQLPGDFGGAVAVLGLLNALDKGNMGGIAYSGLAVADFFGNGIGSQTIGNALGIEAANVLPGLGFVLALDSGDPASIASSGLSLLSSLGYIGPWGAAAAAVISVLGAMGLFGDAPPDIPMREGIAHAEWDGQGNTTIVTDQDIEGGGATASGWMDSLITGLQSQLANTQDNSGNSYALVPNLLPAIGFQYDPDGFNLGNGAKGFMVLRWIDESGALQTRYYDGAGNRGDGSGETLASDFVAHAQGAIAPAWQVATALAHYQQGQGLVLPATITGLPQGSDDGIHQSLQALTLPTEFAQPLQQNAFIDVDGDGYLEQSQWLANNESVLAIDANGNGRIDAGEMLQLNGAHLNSLNWLDTNNDKQIDASDPAFAALRLWIDVNSDGDSRGEVQTLAQAGISAIDFRKNPPSIIYTDGSLAALTVQTLTANILGSRYQTTEGGILQLDEQRNANGTLARAEATLHALNTRQFDAQSEHINGGSTAATTPGESNSVVDGNDARLISTSARTIASQSLQTVTTVNTGDARLQNGAAGQVQARTTVTATTLQIKSSAFAFIPTAASNGAQEQREALDRMIRSAGSSLFDTAGGPPLLTTVAIGAAAVEWPTVASAGRSSGEGSIAHASIVGQIIDYPNTRNVMPDDIRDKWTTDQFRGDIYLSTPDTPSTSGSQRSSVQNTFEETSNVLGLANFPSGQTTTSTSDAAASLSPDVILESISEMGVQATSSQVTTFTTVAGVLLDYPHTQGERASGGEDTTLRFAETLLLANESTVNTSAFPNQPSLRITSVFAPVHGSVALETSADGTIRVVFNPEVNYHGAASFSYTVRDQYGLSSQAITTLSIAAVNDAPVTQDEEASGDEDNMLRFTAASLLANDSDVDSVADGDLLRVTRVGLAEHGQVSLGLDGTVGFLPDTNYNGPAQFSYWVGDRIPEQLPMDASADNGFETVATMRLTIVPFNDIPVVIGETLASDEDVVLNIDPALLLANDTDVDIATNGQEILISAVGNAQHGTIALLPDGVLRFTPERDYFGVASFEYTVDDGNGAQTSGTTVINLAPVNDSPVLADEIISFNEDVIQTFTQASLLANDIDIDNPHSDLRIISVGNATHGTVALDPDGSIRFAPAADYFGPAVFTYTVSDGSGGFSVGTATLDIAPVNDAPRLIGESLTLDEDTEARLSIASLLANDNDVDNEHSDLTITDVRINAAGESQGSVRISDGEIVFTPALNFNGQASFTYTVNDGQGGISDAALTLYFNPINDAPVANGELVFGKKDISYTLSQAALLANDTDVETPNDLHIMYISNVQHGSATLAADGSVRFVPDAGYTGRGSFDYVVMDPDGASSSSTAQIDFSRVNTSPIATDDSFIGFEDVPFNIKAAQLLVNDRDTDNALADLRVTAVGGATHGTVSLLPDGNVRFVPDSDFYGNASFTYQVDDGDGGQTWATAQLTLQSVNDAPIIEDIWYGRPVYGYAVLPVRNDEFGGAIYGYVDVTSEIQARSLYSAGLLLGSSGSFYRNGQLRPVSFNSLDALNVGFESTTPVDDMYRQQGGVVAYDPDGDSSQLSFSVGNTPQHGHAWTNQYTSQNAPPYLDHTQAEPYWVAETGAWQYFSQFGDGFSGGDPFSISVTDAEGASSSFNIGSYHTGSSAGGGGGGKKPVTLDLNGNGLHYIGIDDSKAYFDINNDGWREHLAWIAPDDGLLVLDINGDGKIDRYDEISFTGYLSGAKTDLEGLTAFDSNQDGVLSQLDARWKEFAIWQDKNSDGLSNSGEVRSLDDMGISQINLTSDHQIRTVDGVTEHGQAQFVWDEKHGGNTGIAGDVSLPFDMDARLPAAEAFTVALNETVPVPMQTPTPTPMQMALLMTQMINVLTAAPNAEQLTFIPLESHGELQHSLAAAQEQWEQVGTSAPSLQGATS